MSGSGLEHIKLLDPTNPSMLEPSNADPLSRALLNCFGVMATFFMMPKISENCRRMNRTSCSLQICSISSGVFHSTLYLSAGAFD